jgi:hypothetical protein
MLAVPLENKGVSTERMRTENRWRCWQSRAELFSVPFSLLTGKIRGISRAGRAVSLAKWRLNAELAAKTDFPGHIGTGNK